MWFALLSPFYAFMAVTAYVFIRIERDLRQHLSTPAATRFFKAVVNEKNVEAVGKEVNAIVEKMVGRFAVIMSRLA